MKHTFRNPDLYPELPWRRWFRGGFPSMMFPQVAGISVEDIDIVVTLFGDKVSRRPGEDGKFKLIEVKQGHAGMDYAQKRMYALLDGLLRKGDPDGQYYEGFYLMRWQPPECSINNSRLTMEQLADFFLGKFEIAPLTSDEIMEFGAVL